MSSPEPIHGKVARVLTTREVALNRGSTDGVRSGMVFKILTPKGAEIEDPDTGEVIGSVELEKARVRVTSVQDRVSVASTFRTHRVNVGGSGIALSGIALSRMFTPPKWETRIETLIADENATEDLPEEESFVRTGDPVVQVLDDDDRDTSTQES